MWRRLLALVRKELLVLLQDPKARAAVMVPPLLQLFVFAYAASFDVHDAAVGVLDTDRTALSRAFVARFEGSSSFRVRRLDSEPELRRALDRREVLAVIRIREGFARALLSGEPARVQILMDGRRSNTALAVATYAQRIAESFAPSGAVPRRPVTLEVRAWFNPDLESRWFIVSGLVGMLTLVGVIGVTGMSIARERELGTLEQLLVTPLRPFEVAVGKMVPGLLVGMSDATLILLAARFWFDVPLRGDVALLYGALLVFALSVAGWGLAISAVTHTQQQAIVGVFLFVAPASILSGFAVPIDNMPELLRWLTLADPLRYALVVIRGVFLRGLGFAELWGQIWPMAVIAAVSLALAAAVYRRGMS